MMPIKFGNVFEMEFQHWTLLRSDWSPRPIPLSRSKLHRLVLPANPQHINPLLAHCPRIAAGCYAIFVLRHAARTGEDDDKP